ncbi:MAG: hypothetical protein HS130_02175 [Deltaproteobacteria bacterium]|nr:hypothetical protein [Deltaproteobacteria bacterium]MCL4874145.1 hypothetical protein [bacterium]
MKKIILATALSLMAVFAVSHGGYVMAEGAKTGNIDAVTEKGWSSLARSRIYFGHQSVGNNILDGISDVMKERPSVRLTVSQTSDPRAFAGPVFAHSGIGKNQDPLSKNLEFARFVEAGIGGKADFAFFKYCYIDINSGTDAKTLFNEYRKTLASLKAKYPETTFVHVTVPLTVVQTGWKVAVKKVIGRPIGGYADNIRRNEFNELLLKEYSGKEPVFDLAAVESFARGGEKTGFTANGRQYLSMKPEYASDGRHLNERGRKIVAEELLAFLANLAAGKK